MPDIPGVELVREWQAAMESIAASVGRSDLARQLVAPVQRQAELLQEALEHEQQLQRELLGHAFAPFDAGFDLLEQSAAALREQAAAIEHAAQALGEAASLAKAQAELLERAVHTLREPSRKVESVLGVDDRARVRGDSV